ncbi:MAG: glycosyltransferase [Pseudomonadota bacterium]
MVGWMIALVLCGILLGALTIFAAKRSGWGADISVGVQKVHQHWVPRLGGLPVFATFIIGCLLWNHLGYLSQYSALALVACSLPVFVIGLIEDLSQKAGIRARLVVTMIAAALGWYFLDGQIRRLDVPFVDELLARSALLSFVLTTVAVAGVAHAINIIDGYNGLCGFFSLAAFSGIGAVAAMHGDQSLAQASLVAALSLIGFLFWNYPMGRLFLGDAGAYFIGFLIAEFSILLVTRNPDVSPWCALLIVIYPVWETLFSMYRRAVAGGFSHMGRADALHLHHLVFRRLVKSSDNEDSHRAMVLRNAMTTPYLLVFVLMSVIPAIFFADHPTVLVGFSLVFAVSYLLCYRMIVRLRVPRWLVIRKIANRMLLDMA